MLSMPLFPLLSLSLSFSLLLPCIHTYSSPICKTLQCGNLSITYPFSSYDSQANSYCGLSGFLISCQNNSTAILHLQSDNYTVQSINYANHTVNLVDTIVLDQNETCPKIQNNVSFFPDSGINYTSSVVNITFFYGCAYSIALNYNPIKCFTGADNGYSYVFRTSDIDPSKYALLSALCARVVVAPVLDYYLRRYYYDLTDGFGPAISKGFQLEWYSTDECAKCHERGGQCGYTWIDNSTDIFQCFCADQTCGEKKSRHLGVKIGISLGIISSLLGIWIFCFVFNGRKDQKVCFVGHEEMKSEQFVKFTLESFGSLAPKRYTFYEIRKMTKSFSQKIGQGGCGSVYKGKLPDGNPVAVKVFKDCESDGIEFINEVASVAKTSHVNVVRLLGFSIKGSKRALLYEFMPNGSLDKYLRENGNSKLSHDECTRLFQIALGIARGLEYLHRGCNTRMVHFDIKPHNILLDQDYCPKISDFGLAKFCQSKESIISISGMRGTVGYIAPEIFSRNFGAVSSKSDVYSYGMMVFEMFGATKFKIKDIGSSSDTYFPDCIYKCLEENTICETYGVSDTSEEIVQKMMIIGLWCTQLMPDTRPTMSGVIDMLDRSTKDLTLPPKLPLSLPPAVLAIDSSISTSSLSETLFSYSYE
ncbi:Protein kinase family protein [Rhynchospora pubera]|uniref:Protein kinase family protein n=1 Tax=Rhynchospora pubera TaxID=906938 RepID=A0AAV8HX93_9POAL|nr:Protein kinase family protein [Rhynchospora pubera]